MIIILRVPEHIAIIPDGNRRLARRLLQKPWKGHEWGFEKVKKVIEWSKEFGIKVITIYTLSLENLERRPKRELDCLFKIARRELTDILENRSNIIHRNKVRLNFVGRIEMLPEDIREMIGKVAELTKNYSNQYVNLAIAYGGRQEIIDASKRIAFDIRKGKIEPEEVDEDLFRRYLWTNGFKDPDLIIRTGGERRLSNFLTFQSTYSELVFVNSLWPEITKEDFVNAIKDFGERKRKFGR